jgi:hypothetical protein
MLTLSICFTAAASTSNALSSFTGVQHVDNLKQLSASVPIVLGTTLHNKSAQPLDQPTRLEIHILSKAIQVYISEAYAKPWAYPWV